MNKPKLVITGYARHGKDTLCEILRDKHGFSFESSSQIANEAIIYPILAPKYGYSSFEECYADRVNHRDEWFNLIHKYNKADLTKLGRRIFEKHDIYCGLRNKYELIAMKLARLCNFVVWVDAGERLQTVEDSSSMTLNPQYADIIIKNNGDLNDLIEAANALVTILMANTLITILKTDKFTKTTTIDGRYL